MQKIIGASEHAPALVLGVVALSLSLTACNRHMDAVPFLQSENVYVQTAIYRFRENAMPYCEHYVLLSKNKKTVSPVAQPDKTSQAVWLSLKEKMNPQQARPYDAGQNKLATPICRPLKNTRHLT